MRPMSATVTHHVFTSPRQQYRNYLARSTPVIQHKLPVHHRSQAHSSSSPEPTLRTLGSEEYPTDISAYHVTTNIPNIKMFYLIDGVVVEYTSAHRPPSCPRPYDQHKQIHSPWLSDPQTSSGPPRSYINFPLSCLWDFM